jgi:uncharacterized membrane protein
MLSRNLDAEIGGVFGQILRVLLMQPVPLVLLMMSIFYLWVYLRRDPARTTTTDPGEQKNTSIAQTPA